MSHGTPSALILCEPCHVEVRRDVRPVFYLLRPTAYSLQSAAPPRRGLTLIEMLVALAVTLVMMAAVVNLFANISGSIRNRRAVIEVSGELRQVRARLALDLAGATCRGTTWQDPGANAGYIEIIEGRWNDMFPSELVDGIDDPDGNPANLEIDYATSLVPSGGDPRIDLSTGPFPLSASPPQPGDVTNGRGLGDWDDVLALTVRSQTEPFVAFAPDGTRLESRTAEVIWFADEIPQDDPGTTQDESGGGEPGMRRIYRNVLLVIEGRSWNNGPNDRPDVPISMRYVGNNRWVSNTLGDLSKREYRAARDYEPSDIDSSFPHILERQRLDRGQSYRVLDDALAFDVRVYDPGAPLYQSGPGTVVQPGDPGWVDAVDPTPDGYGAYCDLGWNFNPVTSLAYAGLPPVPPGPPAQFAFARRAGWHASFAPITPPQPMTGFPAVYDTWSIHYESDGANQEPLLLQWARQFRITPMPSFADWQIDTVDQAIGLLDDDDANGTNDPGERETSPPYDVPLRGVKVSLRIYERDARQIRETSVTHSFAQ